MKTRRLRTLLWGCLALVAAGLPVSAPAQGGTPQTLTWTGADSPLLTRNPPPPLNATTSSGLPVTLRVAAAEPSGNTEYLPARAARALDVRHALFTELGRTEFTGDIRDMQVAGQRAYVTRDAGFEIVDVSDPAKPVVIGSYQSGINPAQALDVQGNTVFLGVGPRLEIVDVSRPAGPVKLSEFPVTGAVWDVSVAGTLAHVVQPGGSFRILDVSNPVNPLELGVYNSGGDAGFIKVSGNVAYLAGSRMGLHVVDVSDPAAPTRRSSVAFTGLRARGVDVSGDLAVVTLTGTDFPRGSGFALVDVSDPGLPVLLGEYQSGTQGVGSKVQIVGGHAFLFGSDSAAAGALPLQVFDLSDPANPIPIGGHFSGGAYATGRVVGDHAYVVNSEGLQVLKLRLGYPQRLDWSGVADTLPLLGVGYPLAVTASSGLPLTLRLEFGPATLAGGTLTVTGAGLVQVTADQPGDAAYLPVRETRSFNARQARLSHLGELAVAGNGAVALQVVGSRAYLADHGTDDGFRILNRAFRILDVSDPARPVQLGSLPLTGEIQAVLVVGNRAYLADGGRLNREGIYLGGGLRAVDVSAPATPVMVGGVTTGVGASDVQVAGSLAYLTDWEGLRVLDVSNPASPVPVGQLNLPEGTTRLCVVGNLAYVGNWQTGFSVVDVSNPARPVRLGRTALDSGASDIFVAGHLVYLTTRGNSPKLQVVDVSQPTRPVLVGSLTLPDNGEGLHVVGNTAYVAAWNAGLAIVDVTNPALPVFLGSRDTVPVALGVDVAGNVAYVAAGNAGLQVIEVQLQAPHVAAPGLRVAAVGGQLELAWPAALAAAPLQRRESFAPEHAWQAVTAALVEVNGEIRVSVEASGSAGYFRLLTP
jgi:hypothetical protein